MKSFTGIFFCVLVSFAVNGASSDTVRLSSIADALRASGAFTLINDSDDDARVYFYFYDKDFVAVNVRANGIALVEESFRYTPFVWFQLYPLSIGRGDAIRITVANPETVYVVTSPGYIDKFIPSIQVERAGNYYELAFCGMVFMMMLYVFGKLIQTRAKDYLFYFFHLLFTAVYLFVVLFESKAQVWNRDAETRQVVHHVLQSLSHISYFQFVRYFIVTRVHQPVFDKVLTAATCIGLIYIGVDVLQWATGINSYPELLVWNIMRTFFLSFGLASLLIWVRQSDHPLKRYLIIGTASMLGGGLLGLLFSLSPSVIEDLPEPLNLQIIYFRVGIVAEIVFFSLGLGYKQRLDEISKLKAETEWQHEHLRVMTLQEIDKLKSRFLAGISHEFRTPLTLILGHAQEQLKKDTALTPVFRSIQSNGQHLLNLVTQILDLSKLDSGKLQLRKAEVDIGLLLRQTAAMFRTLAEQKNISLVETHPSFQHVVLADRSVLEKAFNNLISNAIRYTPEGGSVFISIHESKGTLEIQVSDTGIGIPGELHEKIFDRFYRASDDGEGTGIGLALTKELVELHGGKITVTSEVGKGAAFNIVIPVERVKGSQQFAHEPAQFEIKPKVTSEDEPIILVVEDHQELCDYIADRFKEEYRVIMAPDGEKGFDIAVAEVPDIIITDWMMPRMNGPELCLRLKETETTSHIPVIMLTAKASGDSKVEALETGADDYITKPFDGKELQLRVNNMVRARRILQRKFEQAWPFGLKQVKFSAADSKFIETLYEVMKKHLSNTELSIELLAHELGVSRVQLHRKTKSITGHSPGDLVRDYRLEQAAVLLRSRFGNVSEVAYKVGFENLSHFAKAFRNRFGVNPSEFIRLAANQ